MKRVGVDLQRFYCGTIGLGHGLLLAWTWFGTWLCPWNHLITEGLVRRILALPHRHIERVLGNEDVERYGPLQQR